MKKLVMFITIFVSVISILSISNVKADTTHFDIDTLDLSGITSLSGYTPYYVITYSNYWNTEDIIFFRSNVGYLYLSDNSQYQNDVCLSQGACFDRIWSINTNQNSGNRLSSGYWTSNLGQSWTQNVTSSAYSTDPMPDVYVVKSTANIYSYSNPTQLLFSAGYEYNEKKFDIDFVQGSVIMANYNGRIGNLVTYYVKPREDNINIEDYKFCYIENSGGFRDGETCFDLKYWDVGEVVNGVRYYYFYNLPLFYNIGLTYSIYDNNDNLIQTDTINAYLSDLPDLTNYSIYNFQNYEYANMSYINSGLFAISSDLINNVDINVTNITNNTTIPFLTSSYYDSSNSYIDNNGYQWYSFNFNNDNVYLTIINKVNDITDFWAYVDNYDLKLIFDNSAYVHLSGNASSEENKDNPVNQQSYKDINGNVFYNDNPVISDFSDTTGFMSHIKQFFPNINTDTFGLTSIVTAPLNLIQSLVSKTCSPLVLPLPYTNSNITLPCMTQIYKFYYPLLYDIYELVLYGIISYKVIVNIFYEVMKMRQATINNSIEVFDL